MIGAPVSIASSTKPAPAEPHRPVSLPPSLAEALLSLRKHRRRARRAATAPGSYSRSARALPAAVVSSRNPGNLKTVSPARSHGFRPCSIRIATFSIAPSTGSVPEWFEASRAGPSVGMFSMPSVSTRQYQRYTGSARGRSASTRSWSKPSGGGVAAARPRTQRAAGRAAPTGQDVRPGPRLQRSEVARAVGLPGNRRPCAGVPTRAGQAAWRLVAHETPPQPLQRGVHSLREEGGGAHRPVVVRRALQRPSVRSPRNHLERRAEGLRGPPPQPQRQQRVSSAHRTSAGRPRSRSDAASSSTDRRRTHRAERARLRSPPSRTAEPASASAVAPERPDPPVRPGQRDAGQAARARRDDERVDEDERGHQLRLATASDTPSAPPNECPTTVRLRDARRVQRVGGPFDQPSHGPPAVHDRHRGRDRAVPAAGERRMRRPVGRAPTVPSRGGDHDGGPSPAVHTSTSGRRSRYRRGWSPSRRDATRAGAATLAARPHAISETSP